HRAEAAGEQTAADDRADDEDELESDALLRLHRTELERLDDAHQRGNPGGHHEERDLRPGDRNADVPSGEWVPAGAIDPIAEARFREQPGADERDPDPPEHLGLEVVV